MEIDESENALLDLLIDGARYGDMEDVTSALSQQAPIDGKDNGGRTALHVASANGHLEVVMQLITLGADALPYTHLTLTPNNAV